MQRNLKLELVFYTNYSFFFYNISKDIKMTIEKLKTKYPIFIVE